jgi:hypothetical protein
LLIFALVMLRDKKTSRALVGTVAVAPEVLESEIRARLPLGTSRLDVEEFLRKHAIEFGSEAPSSSLNAIVRDLKGNAVVRESLQLRFNFDHESKPRSIDAKVLYTGP